MKKKNFDMDAAIRKALHESIEAHAHEWEPEFKTGVGPVGDDAPFDNKVSEECDKEECCRSKSEKENCESGDVNEGTIPAESREWEPDFKTGVGEVGDDNPFTRAVNEAFVDDGDWEKDSFGATEHKKEGIAYADGADECSNGVVATSQKNSGEVVSKDNLSEETEDEAFGGLRRLVGKGVQKVQNTANKIKNEYQEGQRIDKLNQAKKQAYALYQKAVAANKAYKDFIAQNPEAKPTQGRQNGKFGGNQMAQQQSVVTGQPQVTSESINKDDAVIVEERDRFFNIINRIEKLYD